MIEDQLQHRLHALTFDEPPLPSTTDDIVARGRRRLRRHRVATGAAATLSVSAVGIGGVALAVSQGMVAEFGPATPPAGPAASGTEPAAPDIVPAPPVRDLSADEVEAAFEVCRSGADVGGENGYDGWEPVAGISFESAAEPWLPVTWVIARRGEDYRADCSLQADGQWWGGGGEYGLKSTPDLLYAPVDGQEGEGVGRYAEPVARVTVQFEDESEQEAVLRHGFWFLPYDWQRFEFPPGVATAIRPDRVETTDEDRLKAFRVERQWLVEHGYYPDLIGVPLGYTFRGYDADGDLVYDSSTDGPSVADCYADPTGTEFVGNSADFSDPSECVRTHAWQPLD